MLELACKECSFHFNKKHLVDNTIPMWIIKARGESYYVNHVDCQVPWSTKETPNNSHTKGSIKIKQCLVTIDSDNCAVITKLTKADQLRLSFNGVRMSRIITSWGAKLKQLLESQSIKHGPIIKIGGSCSTAYYITEISETDATMLMLAWPGSSNEVRILKPNESYYTYYDNNLDQESVDLDELIDDSDEED